MGFKGELKQETIKVIGFKGELKHGNCTIMWLQPM